MTRKATIGILAGALLALGPALAGLPAAQAAPPAGTIETLAGTGKAGADSGDGGPAVQAIVTLPSSIAADSKGSIYVLDDFGSRVRKITASKVISTVAGGSHGSQDGILATEAGLSAAAITVDHHDDLIIAGQFDYRIRRVNHTTGIITTVAGTGDQGDSGDGGSARQATFDDVSAVTVDRANDIFVADHNRVRRIDAVTGVITTVAGTGKTGAMGDGGPALAANIPFIEGLAVNSRGDIYISSAACNCVLKAAHADGNVYLVVGANSLTDTQAATPAQRALMQGPNQLIADRADNIYISSGFAAANQVARLDPTDFTLTLVAGTGGSGGYGGDGGPATQARLNQPNGSAITSTGDLVIADYANSRVRIVNAVIGDAPTPPVQPPAATPPTVTAIVPRPITAATPLYEISLRVSLSGGACPSSIDMTLGDLPATSNAVCGPGGHVPATLNVDVRPWDESGSGAALIPGAQVAVRSGSQSVNITLPRPPVWVGVGDSYASGHNQLKSHWNLIACGKNVHNPQDKCGVHWNDPGFAWETHAVDDVNKVFAVPSNWRMSVSVLGRSGASTSTYAAKQVPAMQKALRARSGSWNVVSTTGGADDSTGKYTYTFTNGVKQWYEVDALNIHKGIWDASATDQVGCPNTDKIYATARAARSGIATNLADTAVAAWHADPAVRLIDINYPYVLPKKASCAKGGTLLTGNKHGTTAIIDMLAAAHDDVPGSVARLTSSHAQVLSLDLRDPNGLFGAQSDPRKLLQLTAYFGYPHANAKGQETIASMSVARLTES